MPAWGTASARARRADTSERPAGEAGTTTAARQAAASARRTKRRTVADCSQCVGRRQWGRPPRKMGRTAHAVAREASDNRSVADDTDTLIEELAQLGDRTTLEEALTRGYAQALTLEAERLRLERRIMAVATEGTRLAELPELAQQRTRAERELERLREALGA